MFLNIFVSIMIPLIIFVIISFRLRSLESYLRWQLLMIITPFLIGLAVSIFTSQSPYLITGVLFSGLIYSWRAIFRFPPAFRLAQQQMKSGQHENALASLNQAIQQNPTLWEGYHWRSLINLSQKYYLHAEKDAKKAIELNPTISLNYSTLGQIYWNQANFKEALHHYQKAYQLAPKATAHQINLGISLYKLANYSDSEKLLQRAAKNKKITKPEKLWVHFYLGRNQEILGHHKQAQKSFRRMRRFKDALNTIKQKIETASPALKESLQTDLEELEVRLND